MFFHPVGLPKIRLKTKHWLLFNNNKIIIYNNNIIDNKNNKFKNNNLNIKNNNSLVFIKNLMKIKYSQIKNNMYIDQHKSNIHHFSKKITFKKFKRKY